MYDVVTLCETHSSFESAIFNNIQLIILLLGLSVVL